ncbi:hypothetical protein EYF80_035380 [Liparis tanakae]|uniref:Uncharacterized protein n=1 Tax=Liparis tanakae TaxID=230148 RepID=A0A4Z2GMG0_9TELE|nr:hypothetical protein EYF80_035380 [Liparis tanakae]
MQSSQEFTQITNEGSGLYQSFQVTEKGSFFLAKTAKRASSLKQLDLSYNHPGANGGGRTMRSAITADPNMSLKTLWIPGTQGARLRGVTMALGGLLLGSDLEECQSLEQRK